MLLAPQTSGFDPRPVFQPSSSQVTDDVHVHVTGPGSMSAQQRTALLVVRSVLHTALSMPPLPLPRADIMPPSQVVEVQVWSASWPQPVP